MSTVGLEIIVMSFRVYEFFGYDFSWLSVFKKDFDKFSLKHARNRNIKKTNQTKYDG